MSSHVPISNDAQVSRFGSLRWRIYLGFAAIIGILCVVGGVSLAGLQGSITHFEEYRQAEDLNHDILRIDREVQVLQLEVSRYVESGTLETQTAATEHAIRLIQLTQSVLPRVQDQHMRMILVRMIDQLSEYREQLQLVTVERQLRSELLRVKLPEQAELVESRLETLLSALARNEQLTQRSILQDAQQHFAVAEQDALASFANPSTASSTDTLRSLETTKERLNALRLTRALMSDSDVMSALNAVKDYEHHYVRATQATQNYLYLVDVVLAGVAFEFSEASNQLQQYAELQSAEISQTTIAEADVTRRVTAACLGIALIVGTLISGRLAYRIVRPISSITETFQDLADGEKVDAIPGMDRRDELGEMANAAAVFQEKNNQTEKLLEQSRKLSDELSDKAEEMKQINTELDNFAYVASHDLKSPLRGIGQLASWVVEDANEFLPEDSQVHLEKLQHRVDKMETMLNNLLDYSRVGRSDEVVETVDCHRMLTDVIELLDNPEDIQIHVADEMPTFVTVRTPLEQVFVNLLTNAIKHHDQPSTGCVEVSVEESSEFYRFIVRDDGPGIDPKQHRRIFQMYQRVCDPSIDGCGMGLAIIKKQIELRGGSIGVSSQPGEGSRFFFTWPKATSTTEDEVATTEVEMAMPRRHANVP